MSATRRKERKQRRRHEPRSHARELVCGWIMTPPHVAVNTSPGGGGGGGGCTSCCCCCCITVRAGAVERRETEVQRSRAATPSDRRESRGCSLDLFVHPLRYVALRCVALRYGTLRLFSHFVVRVVLCYVMLCYVVLCYVVSYIAYRIMSCCVWFARVGVVWCGAKQVTCHTRLSSALTCAEAAAAAACCIVRWWWYWLCWLDPPPPIIPIPIAPAAPAP